MRGRGGACRRCCTGAERFLPPVLTGGSYSGRPRPVVGGYYNNCERIVVLLFATEIFGGTSIFRNEPPPKQRAGLLAKGFHQGSFSLTPRPSGLLRAGLRGTPGTLTRMT